MGAAFGVCVLYSARVTSPQDPFAAPSGDGGTRPPPSGQQPPPAQAPPAYGGAPGHGQPGYGPPPGYGQQGGYGPPPGWGQPPGYGGPAWGPPHQRSTNGMAIASLVLGILWLYWVGSILALVFGYVAKRQIRERGDAGSGMATAGLVLGWIGVGALVLVVVIGIGIASSGDGGY